MKTAVKVVLALLLAVGFLTWFIWFSGSKPVFAVEKIELCSATYEFTPVRPDELPGTDTEMTSSETFCKFSYTQGFKALIFDRKEVTISLLGITSNGMKVATKLTQYGPMFYSPMSVVLKPAAVDIYYTKQSDTLAWLALIGTVLAGATGWVLGCLFVRL